MDQLSEFQNIISDNNPTRSKIRFKNSWRHKNYSKLFNDFFFSIVKIFEISENLFPTSFFETRNVESIIDKFENHSRTVSIRNRFDKNGTSSNVNEVIRAVLNLFYKTILHTHTHTHTHTNKWTKIKKTAFYAFKNI